MSRYKIGTQLKNKLDKAAAQVTAESYKELNRDDYTKDLGSVGNPNLVVSAQHYAWTVFPTTKAGNQNASNAHFYATQWAREIVMPELIGMGLTELMDNAELFDRYGDNIETIDLTTICILKKAGF